MLDRSRVRRGFARAAERYAERAFLQREVASRLLERLALPQRAAGRALDLGCGPGVTLPALRERLPGAAILACDLVPEMLFAARSVLADTGGRPVAADAAALPFADGSIGLVFSNLMLQWLDEPRLALGEVARVLAPGGLLVFSTLGPDTLAELRAAWAEADAGPHPHVHPFPHVHVIGDLLTALGFRDPVLEVDRLVLTYSALRPLLDDVRAIGAGNALSGRRATLTGRRRWGRLEAAYERHRRDGRLPATYEVIHGHAWAPGAGPGGERGVALDVLRRALARVRGR